MIKSLLRRFYLPLFSRDLTQMAGRKSTYISRVAFILGLLISFYFFSGSSLSFTSGVNQLGVGGELFEPLIIGEFWAILLLTPLLCCGAIAQEKERDALETLLLTRLSPWKIVLEKYLSRTFPLLLFLLCTLPLLVYLYSLGGITMFEIWYSFYLLTLMILQIGAFTIMCSAFASTSMGALIYTIFAVIFIYAFSSLMMEALFFRILPRYVYQSGWNILFELLNQLPHTIIPLEQFENGRFRTDQSWSEMLQMLLMKTSLIWFSIFAALGMARFFLVRRVGVRTQNVVYAFFKKLDHFFNNANKVTGGVVLIQENQSLPLGDPIAWKEIRKTAIGTARYRIRVLVLLEFPTLFACVLMASERGGGVRELPYLASLLWGIVILLLTVKTTGLITSERLHQTLEVILVSPIKGHEILQQKLKGVKGFSLFLAVPIITVILFKTYMIMGDDGALYPVYALSSMASMLYAVVWICMYVGLRVKNSMRAVFSSFGMILAWMVLPLMLQLVIPSVYSRGESIPDMSNPLAYILNFSPVYFFMNLESKVLFDSFFFVEFLISFAAMVGVGVWFKQLCLRDTDRLLGRLPEGHNASPGGKPVSESQESSETELQAAN